MMILQVRVLAVFAVGCVALGTEKGCGNGLNCYDSQKCVTEAPGAGARYACASKVDDVICSDKRFSCPANYLCDVEAQKCNINKEKCKEMGKAPSKTVPILRNADAHGLLRAGDFDFCSVVRMRLPSFCACKPETDGFVLDCEMDFSNDKFQLNVDARLCAMPAHMFVKVADQTGNIHYEINVDGNISGTYPVPGAHLHMDGVVDAVLLAQSDFQLNAGELSAKVALDACGNIKGGARFCGHDLTPLLPVTVLDQKFVFGRFCTGSKAKGFTDVAE